MSRRPPIHRNSEPAAPHRTADYSRLIRAARAARRHAYAPYSHFPIGAAVLASDGSIYGGANVENASFGLTQCAERVALQTAVVSGRRRLRAVAIAGPAGISACGACRQVMAEFGVRTVILAPPSGAPVIVSLAVLLPRPFGGPGRPRRAARRHRTPRASATPPRHRPRAGL